MIWAYLMGGVMILSGWLAVKETRPHRETDNEKEIRRRLADTYEKTAKELAKRQ